MKLKGTIVSIGRHELGGEAIHGVLVEVPRKQLQQGDVLYSRVEIWKSGKLNAERSAVRAMIAAGDRLNLLLRCEAGIEDSEEWANATREMQLAMIAKARREWLIRRDGR